MNERFQILTYIGDDVAYKRVYIVNINERAYSFIINQREQSTPYLQIPDPGGQMDMVPKYPEQSEWIAQNIKGMEDIDCTWGTVWQLNSKEAVTAVLEILEDQGYLEHVSYETDGQEWIERLIGIPPLRTIRTHRLFMIFYLLTFSTFPGVEEHTVEDLRFILSHRSSEDTATIEVDIEPPHEKLLPDIHYWFDTLIDEFPGGGITVRSDGFAVSIPIAALDAVFNRFRTVPLEYFTRCYTNFQFHAPVSME